MFTCVKVYSESRSRCELALSSRLSLTYSDFCFLIACSHTTQRAELDQRSHFLTQWSFSNRKMRICQVVLFQTLASRTSPLRLRQHLRQHRRNRLLKRNAFSICFIGCQVLELCISLSNAFIVNYSHAFLCCFVKHLRIQARGKGGLVFVAVECESYAKALTSCMLFRHESASSM